MKTLQRVLQISYLDRVRNDDILNQYQQIKVTDVIERSLAVSWPCMSFECLKAGTLLPLFLWKLLRHGRDQKEESSLRLNVR